MASVPGTAMPRKPKHHWFPRWRFFTWVILAFNVAMLAWVISGAASGAKDCTGLHGQSLANCDAGNVGTGIGAGLVIGLWVAGDVILGILWLVTRPHTRDCPACGDRVKRGRMECKNCGYDFKQMLQPGRRAT